MDVIYRYLQLHTKPTKLWRGFNWRFIWAQTREQFTLVWSWCCRDPSWSAPQGQLTSISLRINSSSRTFPFRFAATWGQISRGFSQIRWWHTALHPYVSWWRGVSDHSFTTFRHKVVEERTSVQQIEVFFIGSKDKREIVLLNFWETWVFFLISMALFWAHPLSLALGHNSIHILIFILFSFLGHFMFEVCVSHVKVFKFENCFNSWRTLCYWWTKMIL